MGAVVETNAVFRADTLEPVLAGPIPREIYPLVAGVCAEQEMVSDGIAARDLEKIFVAFLSDPLTTIGHDKAKELFREMVENTKAYLGDYDLSFIKE